MSDEQIKKIIDDMQNDSHNEGIRSMIKEFYCKRMRSIIILVWVQAIVFIALAIFSAFKFFHVEQTRDMIMYAVIFICSLQLLDLAKVFAWQTIHKNSLKREIKRLELCIAELCQKLEK